MAARSPRPWPRSCTTARSPWGSWTSTDAAELAAERAHQVFGDQAMPPADVLGRVVERAGGNPFYLEELLSLVRGRSPGGDLELPDSVERVVLARLDQLSEADKAVVKVASVLGTRFRAEWISGCYPAAGSPAEVARRLRRLEALQLTLVAATRPPSTASGTPSPRRSPTTA